ncbi:Carboxyl transferase domain-containing protein, partial [Brevibacterium jeotgali]
MTDNGKDNKQPSTGTDASSSNGPLWWEGELKLRSRIAMGLGGSENIQRQHARGQLTARERLDCLVDEGSWREVGLFTGKMKYDDQHGLIDGSPANAIAGTGTIEQRDVAVSAEDFTVRGGSSESTSPEKWQYIERYALEYRIPIIRLVETAGGSINLLKQSSGTKIPGYTGWPLGGLLGTVPVIGIAMGAAAGLGAVRVVASHFSVMVAGSSYVFAGGPAVVKPGVGQEIDKEELGGASVHAR